MNLIFLGDTQRTHFLERLIGREQNDPERESIIAAVSAEEARAVFFLGDLVSIGALQAEWDAFDRLIRPLTQKKVPLYTVYGNHDYFFHGRRAREFMGARFPHLKASPWSAVNFGELTVVTIDSNKKILSQEQWETQKLWLAKTLAELEQDAKIRGVVLALHHPPYSNSRHSRASQAVREEIVPLFTAAPKTLALISGHCHAYERFEMAGKSFIVSGGAGGPRVQMLERSKHRHPDLYAAGGALRPFHYLRTQITKTGTHFTVMGLDKSETQMKEIDSFTLNYK